MELCCNLDVKTEESAGVCDLKLLTKDNGKCRHIDLQLMTMNSVVNLIYQLKTEQSVVMIYRLKDVPAIFYK